MGYVDFNKECAKVNGCILEELLKIVEDMLKQQRNTLDQAKAFITAIGSHIEGIDNHGVGTGSLLVLKKVLNSLFTNTIKDHSKWANKANPESHCNVNTIKKAKYRVELTAVVSVIRKNLSKHLWEEVLCKADGKTLKPEKTVVPYNVFLKLCTICIKPGDKEENDIIKRQNKPGTRWSDRVESMERKVDKIETKAKELSLECSIAQIIKWVRNYFKRMG